MGTFRRASRVLSFYLDFDSGDGDCFVERASLALCLRDLLTKTGSFFCGRYVEKQNLKYLAVQMLFAARASARVSDIQCSSLERDKLRAYAPSDASVFRGALLGLCICVLMARRSPLAGLQISPCCGRRKHSSNRARGACPLSQRGEEGERDLACFTLGLQKSSGMDCHVGAIHFPSAGNSYWGPVPAWPCSTE